MEKCGQVGPGPCRSRVKLCMHAKCQVYSSKSVCGHKYHFRPFFGLAQTQKEVWPSKSTTFLPVHSDLNMYGFHGFNLHTLGDRGGDMDYTEHNLVYYIYIYIYTYICYSESST